MTTKTGQRIALAFRDGRARTIKRTVAGVCGRETGAGPMPSPRMILRIYDSPTVWLHNNPIAYRDHEGVVWMTLAGYPTRTTRDRLNAILEAYGSPNRFFQDKGVQYYGRRATFHNAEVEVGAHEWVPLAGPLGMLALQAARRQEDQALQDACKAAASAAGAHLERRAA